MKKIVLYTIIPLLIISCNSKEATNRNKKSSDNDYFFGIINSSKKNGSLIEKKFKEFYDLNTLLKKYPNFKENIEKRIDNFTTGTSVIFDLTDSLKITNIRQQGGLTKISDSVQMTKVLFDIVSGNMTKTDSVLAFITKKKVLIDSEEVISTKVKFTRVTVIKF